LWPLPKRRITSVYIDEPTSTAVLPQSPTARPGPIVASQDERKGGERPAANGRGRPEGLEEKFIRLVGPMGPALRANPMRPRGSGPIPWDRSRGAAGMHGKANG
jgi:hypothetical protein